MSYLNISLIYLLRQGLRRIADFFRHWYMDGFRRAAYWFLNFLERMDKVFALRITFKNLFQPLYQDYSFIGYVWGFIFRSLRIFVALVVYAVFSFIAVFIFIAWAFVPILIIYEIFHNL